MNGVWPGPGPITSMTSANAAGGADRVVTPAHRIHSMQQWKTVKILISIVEIMNNKYYIYEAVSKQSQPFNLKNSTLAFTFSGENERVEKQNKSKLNLLIKE